MLLLLMMVMIRHTVGNDTAHPTVRRDVVAGAPICQAMMMYLLMPQLLLTLNVKMLPADTATLDAADTVDYVYDEYTYRRCSYIDY